MGLGSVGRIRNPLALESVPGRAPRARFSRTLFPGGDCHVLPQVRDGDQVVLVAVDGDDCNAQGLSDSCEIACGTAADANRDGVPDTCQLTGRPGCEPMDLDGDGVVDQADFGVMQRCISGPRLSASPQCAAP